MLVLKHIFRGPLKITSEKINFEVKNSLKRFLGNSVNNFFVFAWEFCIEKWRGFWGNFFWSPSPTKRSAKSPRKIRGKFGAKFGAKLGTKYRKIRETFVLQLS